MYTDIINDKPRTFSLHSVKLIKFFILHKREIIATYFRNNKFLILSFSEEQDYDNFSGIRLRDNSLYANNITQLCEGLEYAKQLTWYEIDFGNIIYELSIDISKLSKSKLKRLKELTKGSVI